MKVSRVAMIFLLGALLLVACEYKTTGPSPQIGTADVQILTEELNCEPSWWGEDYTCYITGIVENTGDGDASGVSLEAEFFDRYGIRLDTGFAYIGDLRPGQSAYYEVYYSGERPSTYEIWVDWWE